MRTLDLTGKRFGRLTAVSQTRRGGRVAYLCQCDCGGEITTMSFLLTSGRSVSCGCKRRMAATTHGKSHAREFRVWADMRRRCSDENNKNYPYYGGRGIVVCARWESFENFFSDMGECPAGHSIDRRDNNGPYAPDNCHWVGLVAQARNRRNTKILSFNGESMSLIEWSERLSIPYDALKRRLLKGWSVERAFTTEVRK